MAQLFLLRYDTERASQEEMAGFFEQAIAVHREHRIPATFFCQGAAIDAREADFAAFYREVKDDRLFDIQDHSYSHVGVGYRAGKSVEALRADFQRSFDAHERVFGVRPTMVSRCGTKEGPRLNGLDETAKGRAELDMLAELGVQAFNAVLTGVDESRQFAHYGALGHPDLMGFPSGYSDTGWMHRREHGDPLAYILGQIEERASRGEHMPLMLHDWVAWNHAPDRALGHVRTIVDAARRHGYELVTHIECYRRTSLWKDG